jgi:hypothetical protein
MKKNELRHHAEKQLVSYEITGNDKQKIIDQFVELINSFPKISTLTVQLDGIITLREWVE